MGWGRRTGQKAREKGAAAKEVDVEAKALSLLAMRDHAVGELTKKLKDRYYPQKHIDAVIARFQEIGYLDDERTSGRLAINLKRQGWGPIKIRIKMRNKGFKSAEIDDAIAEIDDEESWIEDATERVRTKFKKEPEELEDKEKEKAYRHLAYRGFPGGIVREVLFR